MAASSPAISNNSTDSPTHVATTAAAATATTNASKNLRGLNKPKCIKCGNVARSRCPYQSCKSCCAKAQNPCHIHVLKGSSTIPDKLPSLGSPLFDQQSNEVPSSMNSFRGVSLRQLSNNFAQFNNLQTPLRSRKPLSRKDAAVINEWRFLKLKEYKDSKIEAENEAFDRYMQNVQLLEEVFYVNSTQLGSIENGSSTVNPNSNSVEDDTKRMIAGMKLRLRSNPVRTENLRKRMQFIVYKGLRKLQKTEPDDGGSDLSEQGEFIKRQVNARSRLAERASALSDLIDKLNKARNEEDLKACMEMKSQLFNRHTKNQVESEDLETSEQETAENVSPQKRQPEYSPPKWFRISTIDQETLNRVDAHFSSLEDIEDL